MENGELKLEQLLIYYRFSHMNLSYLGFALLHTISDNQMVKKIELLLWKLSSIQMKILNDIACKLELNWDH